MWRLPTNQMKKSKLKYGKHFRQYICCYEPLDSSITRKKNIIVYFHGGGWQFSRPEAFAANAQSWVNEGYTVFMPSHRRIPFFQYHHMREDLNLILHKILLVLQEKDLVDSKVILGGMSSGANLAALVLYDRMALNNLNLNQNLFSGLFLLGAPLNLEKMRPSPTIWLYAGKKGSKKFQKANPIQHLSEKENTPVLGIHGTKDGLVEFESAASFYEKLETINSDIVQFLKLKNQTHLEVAGWSFKNQKVQKALFKWMDDFEKH